MELSKKNFQNTASSDLAIDMYRYNVIIYLKNIYEFYFTTYPPVQKRTRMKNKDFQALLFTVTSKLQSW